MGDEKKKENPKAAVSPFFRVSFPAVFKPRAYGNQEPVYSVQMLFPKETDLAPLKLAAQAAADEKWGDKKPKNMRSPFRDGEEKDLEEYQGMIFVTAKSKQAPGVVSQSKQKIEVEGDFYAGCWARATVIAYAYDMPANKGVAFALENLQKVRDDTPFSGRRNAEESFDELPDSGAGENSESISKEGLDF
jgi:hypothetical protein